MTWHHIVEEARRLKVKHASVMWAWADLCAKAAPEAKGSREKLEQLKVDAELEQTVGTLVVYRAVALAWPVEKRCPSAAFNAHKALMTHPDRFTIIREGLTENQARIINGNKASSGRKGSFVDALAYMRSARGFWGSANKILETMRMTPDRREMVGGEIAEMRVALAIAERSADL